MAGWVVSNDAGGVRVFQDFAPIGVEVCGYGNTGRGDVQSSDGTGYDGLGRSVSPYLSVGARAYWTFGFVSTRPVSTQN